MSQIPDSLSEPCSVSGCGKTERYRGYCIMHYRRWQRHGDPHITFKQRGSLADRLWAKVTRSDGCWLWTGARNPAGYGHLTVDGRTRNAHKAVYELLIGPVAEGLTLDHLCRNPSCVRPDHLEPVTQLENYRRGVASATTRARHAARRAARAAV